MLYTIIMITGNLILFIKIVVWKNNLNELNIMGKLELKQKVCAIFRI